MLPKIAYYHAFNCIDGIGYQRLQSYLASAEGNIALAWESFEEISRNRFSPSFADKLIERYRTIDVDRGYELLQNQGISTIVIEQKKYPPLLKQISQPPFILYYRGRFDLPPRCLTVVGTRKMTPYGRACLQSLLPSLAGVGIVSGLAFGVDACAHETALKHGLYTMAVLASGVDVITPPAHQALAERIIASGGAVVSERPPGSQPTKGSFPRRNRILAGLTPLTLVVEADIDSGSLITARIALDENRDVAAVPGSIFSQVSAGTHKLLRDGARLVTGAQDLIGGYNVSAGSPRVPVEVTEDEQALLAILSGTPTTIDQLLTSGALSSSAVLSLLTTLELKGLISYIPGQGYAKTSLV